MTRSTRITPSARLTADKGLTPLCWVRQAEAGGRQTPRSGWRTILLLVLLLGILVQTAFAQGPARLLDAPRAAGIVGERYDGFAVTRGAAPPEIAALVNKVNAERQAVYAERAAKDGAPSEAVGKIYAAEILNAAPAGTWFLSESGSWTQK